MNITEAIKAKLEKYSTAEYLTKFRAIGIGERFMGSWFCNYGTETEEQVNFYSQFLDAEAAKKSVILLGNYGTGKTHLMCAAVKNAYIKNRSAHYYTLTSLMRAWRDSFKEQWGEGAFIKRLNETDLLCIDEFNIRSNSEAENRFLQELFDSIYVSNRQVMIGANLTAEEFFSIVGERVKGRLKSLGAVVFAMNWTSHRGREHERHT